MATRRKPTRARKWRPFYSHVDVLMASATQPMPEALRRHWLTRVHLALEALARGKRPDADDWRMLSDAVNLMETMVRHGLVSDPDGVKERAKAALALSGQSLMEGRVMRVDGVGLMALRDLLADMSELMATMAHRDFVKVHVATERYVREVLLGQGRPGDVVVAV